MDNKEKELMERYIYEVIRRVSKEQQEDIQLELKALIEDMYEDKNDETDIEDILKKLGDPAIFAKQYQDESKYLISPEYYDDYSWLVKVVLGCILLSAVVSFLIQMIIGQKGFSDCLGDSFGSLLVGSMVGFGIVTLLFAGMERRNIKIEFRKKWTIDQLSKDNNQINSMHWIPTHLPPVPDKRALISRGDCIANIIFTVIFCVLLPILPSLVRVGISVRLENDQRTLILFPFHYDYWHIILPLLLISLGISLAYEIYKLITGRYCKHLMLVGIVYAFVEATLALILLKGMPFFNPDFAVSLQEYTNQNFSGKFDLLSYWNTDLPANVLLAIILAAILLETGTLIYKTLRYGIKL